MRGDLFFHYKTMYMLLYFLVKKGNELRVMRITPEEEVTFRLLYQDQVLVEGSSVNNVLTQFMELPIVIGDGFT